MFVCFFRKLMYSLSRGLLMWQVKQYKKIIKQSKNKPWFVCIVDWPFKSSPLIFKSVHPLLPLLSPPLLHLYHQTAAAANTIFLSHVLFCTFSPLLLLKDLALLFFPTLDYKTAGQTHIELALYNGQSQDWCHIMLWSSMNESWAYAISLSLPLAHCLWTTVQS